MQVGHVQQEGRGLKRSAIYPEPRLPMENQILKLLLIVSFRIYARAPSHNHLDNTQ